MAFTSRSRFALLLVGTVLIVGILGFLLSTWDGTELGEWVREFAGWRNIEMDGSSFRLSALDGLVIQTPTVRFSLPRGEFLLKASSANVEFNLIKFLGREYSCNDITARRAHVALVFNMSSPRNLPEPDEPDRMAFEVNRLRCKPRTLTLENSILEVYDSPDSKSILVFEGLHLLLREPKLGLFGKNPLVALSANGEFSAQRMMRRSEDAEVPRTYSNVEGRLKLLDGKIEITELHFKSRDGDFEIRSGTLDLTRASPTFKGGLSAEISDARFLLWDLDIALAKPLQGKLLCRISGPLSRLSVRGHLLLDPDTTHLRQVPLIEKAGSLILTPPRTLKARDRWNVPFTLENSRIGIDNAKLGMDPLAITLSGVLQPGQDISLLFDLLVPKQVVAGRFSPAVLSDLQVADSVTTIRIPGRISGTLGSPTIRLRTENLSQLAVAELEEYLRGRGIQDAAGDFLP